MPSQTQQSKLPEDAGLDALLQKGARDKTTTVSRDLPGGIKGGIGRLIEGRIGVYKKGPEIGKQHLYLAGNILDPEFVDAKNGKVKVRGRRTSKTLPLCDAKGKKQSENVNEALALVRALGGVDCTEGLKKVGDLDALAKGLVKKGIIFSFNTTETPPQTKPDPKNPGKNVTYPARVWENWEGTSGVPVNYQAPKPQGITPAKAETNGDAHSEAPEDNPADEQQEEQQEEETTTAEEASNEPQELPGDNSIDELVEQADAEDKEARAKLTAFGVQIGKTTEEVEGADSWSDVGEWIREARNAGGEGETAAEEEAAPEEPEPKVFKVGEVCKVKLLVKSASDPTKLVKSKKYTEVKIKSIDKAKGTCVVTDLATKKEIKGIKLDALEEN